MVDASKFVDGANVRVRLLVGTLVGGFLISIWDAIRRLIVNTGFWIRRVLSAPVETLASLIEEALAIPADSFELAYSEGVGFVFRLGPLGPINYVVTVAVVVLLLWIGSWTIARMGVI